MKSGKSEKKNQRVYRSEMFEEKGKIKGRRVVKQQLAWLKF